MDEGFPTRGQVTEMLKVLSDPVREATDGFMPLLYDELRRQAHRHLRRERPNHTLQTTALVHEAYLRLTKQHDNWQSQTHFLALAAQMMRWILVNYAVNRRRDKRGGIEDDLSLTEALNVQADNCEVDLLALDEALTRLEELDERQARIVELRYFSGLTVEATAEVLDISPATVKRDWNMARAWLRRELS